ncbi:MAG: carboxylesterase/lipase family protein [Streptosporangiaceae bacterium]
MASIAQGKIVGVAERGVARYLGLPYAAPPFGRNRFLPPQPVRPWDGVRDAREFGPTVPMAPYRPPLDVILGETIVPGEECLNLNVWAPVEAQAAPVMVWIHGGAFRNGSGRREVYDGATFARDGVVCVTLNYRLGVEGFAHLPGAVDNRGLLDQIAALQWVRDNIAAFGGDPGNVTVFGESAGGMSVTTLLSLDLGLFHRAIAQSGAGHIAQAPEDALKVTTEIARRLGVTPDAAGLAAIDPWDVIPAQSAVATEIAGIPDPARWGPTTVANAMPFMPVLDGTLFTRRPIDAIAAGAGRDVAVLTGTTTEEFRLFLAPTGLTKLLTVDLAAGFMAAMGIDPAVAEVYRQGEPGDILCEVLTDFFFRVPAIRLAEARPAHTWMYEFAWASDQHGLGACHALELPFVFDSLVSGGGTELVGHHPPQDLANAMHHAWVAFATTGDPGWAPYDTDTRKVMVFDAPGTLVVQDPRSRERRRWDGLR